MTDDAAKLLADALNNLAGAIRDAHRQVPARGLNTAIRAQDTYTGKVRRVGFGPAYAEHEEDR